MDNKQSNQISIRDAEKLEKKLRDVRALVAQCQMALTQELAALDELIGELQPGVKRKRKNKKAERMAKYDVMYADKFKSKVD